MNMKRIGAVVAVLTAAALGLVGCSSDSEPAEETVEETTSTVEETADETAAEETTEADVALTACLALQEPFAEAQAKLSALAADESSDPEDIVEMYSALADALTEVSETASDATLAAQAQVAADDANALVEATQKVYVEEDFNAMEEYTTATTDFMESYQELMALCGAEL